jgi:glycosyltransferase involved in cell wall biosynthesis
VPRSFDPDRPLRILWSGELRPSKGLHLLLDALGRQQAKQGFELRILGSGSFEPVLRRRAAALGVDDRCQWLGWRPFDAAQREYAWADVLAFTSLRDTSGNVMLEALAQGVPVIALDHQGATDVVTDSCGFKIPVVNPEQCVDALATVLAMLIRSRMPLYERSRGALDRARALTWSKNGAQMGRVYEQVCLTAARGSRM